MAESAGIKAYSASNEVEVEADLGNRNFYFDSKTVVCSPWVGLGGLSATQYEKTKGL